MSLNDFIKDSVMLANSSYVAGYKAGKEAGYREGMRDGLQQAIDIASATLNKTSEERNAEEVTSFIEGQAQSQTSGVDAQERSTVPEPSGSTSSE